MSVEEGNEVEQAAAEGRALEKLGRRLLVPAALAFVALAGLAVVSDGRELLRELGNFPVVILWPVLGLSLVNYGLRFVRWELYLDQLEIQLARKDSLAIFLVGFVLSVTPGKAGELGKAWLARELGGGPARRGVAAVIGERATDSISMFLLAGLGALAFPGARWLAIGLIGVAVLLTLVLGWHGAVTWLLGLMRRLPGIGHRLSVLDEVYGRFRSLLKPSVLIPSVVVGSLAWGAEGVGFWLVVRSYDPSASLMASVFNYCASTLAGGLSMLPGGLVASEGALTALLDFQGLETAAAASATLVIRGATLWFAVAIGLCAVPYVLRRLASRRSAQGSDAG